MIQPQKLATGGQAVEVEPERCHWTHRALAEHLREGLFAAASQLG